MPVNCTGSVQKEMPGPHAASLNKILVSRAKESVFLKEPSGSFLGESLTKLALDSAVHLTTP